MAGKIEIFGETPSVNLNARSFSDDMKAAGCPLWATLASPFVGVTDGRITSVSPRVGSVGLTRGPDSLGPQYVDRSGYGCAKFVDEQLNYLYYPPTVDGTAFSIAVIIRIEAYQTSNNNLFSLYSSGANTPARFAGGKVQVLSKNGTEMMRTAKVFSSAAPSLFVLSSAGGTTRLHARDASGAENMTSSVASNITSGQVVFGGDEISDGHSGAAPSVSNAFRDVMYDALVFDRDILASPQDPAFSILTDYFEEAYLNA